MVSERIKAMRDELDAAASAYIRAKDVFERHRVQFDTERHRFMGVRELARGVMSEAHWARWRSEHPQVRYAAMPIGEAILAALYDYAWNRAQREYDGDSEATPYCEMDDIIRLLEKGGFDFRSTTPGREVNAALRNLAGIDRAKDGSYAVANYDRVLADVEKERKQMAEEGY